MPQCPQCSKPLVELTRQCPSCRADLDLLVDYVSGLQGSLDRATHFTRVGELGQAVWAYLEVLEVDPDNPVARHQVGQVATAVRQFDRTTEGRRWARGLSPRGKSTFRWATGPLAVMIGLALAVAFGLGFLGGQGLSSGPATIPDDEKSQQVAPIDRNAHIGN
jgi:hypothetical protein